MTMSVSSTSAPMAAVQGAGAASKVKEAASSGGFLSAMTQLMNQSETSSESQSATVSLPALSGVSPQAVDEDENQLLQLLDSLLQDLGQAEQLLENNPELMAMLQQWLQQAQMFTSTAQMTADTAQLQGSSEQSDAIQALAAQSETLSILVRDQLEQMREILRPLMNGASMNQSAVLEGAELLESLQALLSSAGKQPNSTESSSNRSMQSVSALANQQNVDMGGTMAAVNKSGQAVQETNGKSMNMVSELRAAQSTAADRTIGSSLANAGKQAEVQNQTGANLFASASTDDSAAIDQADASSEVITAGQFAIRSEGMQSSKPVQVIRASHFAQEMGGFVMKQLFVTMRNGVSEAKITLYPENLGQVDVRLTMQNGQLVAQFVTERAIAKELLDQQMFMLRGALQSQGIQVDKLEVTQHSSVSNAASLSSSMFQGDQQSNGSRGQNSAQRNRQQGETSGEIETLDDIQDELLRKQLIGSSFQASV
ncbi:flagellar hook-length control protein FliK [Paenibacillus marinisediminis]